MKIPGKTSPRRQRDPDIGGVGRELSGPHLALRLEAHDWLLRMVVEYEEFEVETDQPGEEAMPFWSETVRGVLVEKIPFAA